MGKPNKNDIKKTKDQLMHELMELRRRVAELEVKNAKYRQIEVTLKKREHDLSERVKELNCLYGISNLAEKQGVSPEEMLKATVALIPPSWQYPEITCARIILNGQEFVTGNFSETVWKQTCDIIVHDNRIGSVQVYYSEERPECNEGPFLKEERNLINAIAERVGRITEHQRAEEILRVNEEWLSTTLRSIGDAVIVTDAQGNVVLMNSVAQTLTGWNEEDAMGKSLMDVFNIINEETGKQPESPVARVIREGIVVELANHTVLIAKDGTKRPIDDSGAPIRDDKGNITSVVLVFRDITERRRLEHAMGERLKELQCLYGISQISERAELSFNEVCQEVVNLLPPSWQYPEITCSRITIGNNEFKTINYRENDWKQLSDIKVHGKKIGIVEVCYLEERHAIDEGPFLKEERLLIDVVAERLGKIGEQEKTEVELKQSEENLRNYMENAPDGIYINDLKGKFLYGNKKAEEIMGHKKEELIGKSFLKLNLLPARYIVKAAKLLALNALGKPTGPDEFELVKKNGSRIMVEINTNPIKERGKAVVIGFVRDVTKRQLIEKELRIKDSAIASSITAMAIADLEGNITYINSSFLKMWGYNDEKEVLGKKAIEFWQLREGAEKVIKKLQDNGSYEGELAALKKDGAALVVMLSASMVTNIKGEPISMLASFVDITDRKRAEEKIKASLVEKEILLKEVHHRVKNNMQVISSLLKLQSGSVEDKNIKRLFKDSQNRIQSMALVYNKLYQSKDLARINLKDYIYELSTNLLKSYSGSFGKIKIWVDGDDILLGVDQAIPCGLIINEMITNSLKYAFPNSRRGEIRISINTVDKDDIEIIVSDNGIGIPAGVDIATSETLGLRLINMLVSSQLDGKVDLDRSHGTKFCVVFKKPIL